LLKQVTLTTSQNQEFKDTTEHLQSERAILKKQKAKLKLKLKKAESEIRKLKLKIESYKKDQEIMF
jgi:hypothetical protein